MNETAVNGTHITPEDAQIAGEVIVLLFVSIGTAIGWTEVIKSLAQVTYNRTTVYGTHTLKRLYIPFCFVFSVIGYALIYSTFFLLGIVDLVYQTPNEIVNKMMIACIVFELFFLVVLGVQMIYLVILNIYLYLCVHRFESV